MADDVNRIALDGELTIYRAADLKVLVLDALRKTRVLEIDLSGVTELDTAGLQVLMLAKQTAAADQRNCAWCSTALPWWKSSRCWTWSPSLATPC
jgi:anti-anti-sigma regulatory factor